MRRRIITMHNSSIKIIPNLLIPWIHGTITYNSNLLYVKSPHTHFLGLITTGNTNKTIQLQNISSIEINHSYKWMRIFIGLVLSGGLIGIPILLSGIQTYVIIYSNGSTEQINIPFYEKNKAQAFVNDVIKVMSKNSIHHLNEQSKINTNKIVNAISNK